MIQKVAYLKEYISMWMCPKRRNFEKSFNTIAHINNQDRFLFSNTKTQANIKQNKKVSSVVPSENQYSIPKINKPKNKDLTSLQQFLIIMNEDKANLIEIDNILVNLQQFNPSSLNRVEEKREDIQYIKHEFNERNSNYQNDIVSVRDFKYQQQHVDYPVITFENYTIINKYWQTGNNLFKKIQLPNHQLSTITYKDIKTLSLRNWLNDEIINKYISFMNDKLISKNYNYRILHSQFFSVFTKGDKKIKLALQKQKVNKNSIIVAVIHNLNHWFFIQIRDGVISIFDSLPQSRKEAYENVPVIKNYMIFASSYYGMEHTLQVRRDYPTQNNGHDCGVMMLFGMKDVVRSYKLWSFSVHDCKYKRYQITQEILKNKITGFD